MNTYFVTFLLPLVENLCLSFYIWDCALYKYGKEV